MPQTDTPAPDARNTEPQRHRVHELSIALAATVWLLGIAFGVRELYLFESTAGATGTAPATWPAGSPILRDRDRMSLVMVIHPQCSCTRASLTELSEVMERAHGRITAWVMFVQPQNALHGSTWNEAARLPGVQVGVDPTGAEAARFGALTSGYVVLYDAAGTLRFSGGITAARGHAGENRGRDQVLAMIDGTTRSAQRHAVFGCSLDGEPAPRPAPATASPEPAGAG